jgi:hypothetical protein
MTWQPIDTAHKDQRVLLYYPQKIFDVVCGSWQTEKHARKPRPHWRNDSSHILGIHANRQIQPTHWMALPNDPAHDNPDPASGESAITTPADDALNELAAALYRIQQLERVLWLHIRTYRVDDQHPDPDAEVNRIMQKALHGLPKLTTENDQS